MQCLGWTRVRTDHGSFAEVMDLLVWTPFKNCDGSTSAHESGMEFERFNISRVPKGTTSGAAANQHTGTGLVERHVQLMKLIMLKLQAEMSRQGVTLENEELAGEAAMAQNITLNYGGVTPAICVFGTLPRGFYEEDGRGIMATSGALQTDLTVFERALRIRQAALAQCHQAINEDRIARASRSRPRHLDTQDLIMGTSEVEFYRENPGDPGGWRGPALLLRLETEEGTAVVQYQGRPYLVSLRHIRPFRGIFMVTTSEPSAEHALLRLLGFVEQASRQDSLPWLAQTAEWKVDTLSKRHFSCARDCQEGRDGFLFYDKTTSTWNHVWRISSSLQTPFRYHWNHDHLDSWRKRICGATTPERSPCQDEEDFKLRKRRDLSSLLLLLRDQGT